jgi:hypothetical protein
MLPVTSTFTGHLGTAEAIYDGPNSNLIGVQTFSGSGDNQAPQQAVLLGMSGSGKSVTVCDLLTQTEGYFGYTVIIEEGLSYGIYTATVQEGARPIIIHPDGDLTINYLDTKGLPLSPIGANLTFFPRITCKLRTPAPTPFLESLTNARASPH